MPAQAQISGYDPRSIEIDGNVTLEGTDPFTDWLPKQLDDTLVGITDGIGNADGDILSPGSVLKPGSTLPKEDISHIYLSNNNSYLYVAEERRANNGNSGWHLFFTKIPPTAVIGQNVIYHLQKDDIEIQICFPKGSDPSGKSINVRQVADLGGATIDVPATELWTTPVFFDNPAAVWAFEVNSVVTSALAGAIDSKGKPTNIYDVAEFGEAAISLQMLNINICGAKAYASVITRSSCSLTSDIKDFAGPVLYIFGGPTVSPITNSVDCANKVTLSADISKGTAPYRVQWYDNDQLIRDIVLPEPATDSFEITLQPGIHTIKVVVTDDSGCSSESTTDPFQVHELLGVTLTHEATCQGLVTWTATATGGDGSNTFSWKVDGEPVSGSGPTLLYGPVADCADHTISVTVTDGRGCAKDASKTINQSVTTAVK